MSAAVTLSTYETDRLITARDRFKGITRPYAHADVLRLRGSIHVEYTLARLGSERLWDLLHSEPFAPSTLPQASPSIGWSSGRVSPLSW